MKKIVLIVILIISCIQAKAQDVFAPSGAEWYYTFWDSYPIFGPPNEGYIKIWYDKDTIVQSKSCKLLKKYCTKNLGIFDNLLRDEIIYVNGDTVFRLADDNLFYELYHFNANVGDTITSRVYFLLEDKDTTLDFIVYSIGSAWINGIEKRALNLIPLGTTSPPIIYGGRIEISPSYNVVETLGGTEYMFPWTSHWLDISLILGVRCYSDDFLGSYSSGIVDSCDYISDVWEEKESYRDLDIYPNPSSDEIRLRNSADFTYYVISNQLGQGIQSGKIDAAKIEIRDLAKGIYFLKVLDREKHFYMAKFVKE